QNFANGAIYAGTSGPRAGGAWFVTGLILTAYNGAGGAGGDLGMPLGGEFVTAGLHQQNFEGGSITYTGGAAAAQVQSAPKVPAVFVAPSAISAGASARLAVSGFPNGASIRVSVTGQPDFVVATANGAYSWSMFIPLSAASGTLSVRAQDSSGTVTASGTLTIKGFDNNRVQMTVVRGDRQTGAPGTLLPVPLQIAMLDASGAPVVGAPISFQASPGGQISVSSTVTDANGQASTYLRLPAAAGVAGVTAASSLAQSPVTFYASASAASLANYPSALQSGSAPLGNGMATIAQKGALLSAVASILRYQQNRGAIPAPNGLADALTLNQFLTAYCGVDVNGVRVCDGFVSNANSSEQIVNLWRAAQFTGGLDVVAVSPTLSAAADLVAQGEPVLLSLSLSQNGTVVGGHFVVATGIGADGSILIQDPSPLFARSSLSDYLNGFSSGSTTWSGSLTGAARFAVRSPSATRFLLSALSQPAALMSGMAFDIGSPSGECGIPIGMLDTVDAAGNVPASGPLVSRFQVCDGSLPAYQVSVGAAQSYSASLADLASAGSTFDLSGGAPATWQATRPLLNLAMAPASAAFPAAGVVNAATFTSGIAPGGMVSIFGSGLAMPPAATMVDVDGEATVVLSSSAFQLNAVLPADLAPGTHTLRVKSPFGTAQQQITMSAVAPAIFLVGNPQVGAVENQDGSLNSPANPLARGETLVVYCTGLGVTTKQGQYSLVNVTVTAVVNGVELPVNFAGLTPGYAGLYQVNVPIPAGLTPGLGVFLTLKQGGQVSESVSVAIE
ncbi:MAG TPA: Ig-like domain-containing protein, partial [Candidatus Sulfopaludibacter sp.]|nr:Ig-like domain-containing protein [Candidatus Sulfopaludibacter sp.]